MEHWAGFRQMFRMDLMLAQILDLISPQESLGRTAPTKCDETLALTLTYLTTGESFQSLRFQYTNLVECSITCCQRLL